MLASELITAIRKLVLDESISVFSNSQILRVIGLVQQDFCVRSECYVKVIKLASPPQFQYSFVFDWEEGALGDERVFCFLYRSSSQKATQQWELESTAQNTAGGNTLTGGADLEQVDPQMQIPYPLGEESHKVMMLIYDYGQVEEKARRWVEENFRDCFTKRGDIVDYFSFVDELRKNSLFLYGMPYAYSNVTSLSSALDSALAADVGYAVLLGIPSRPATTTAFEINQPFVKYIGFGAAGRLLAADTELRNVQKSDHFLLRYEVGVSICRRVAKKGWGYKDLRAADVSGKYLRSSLSRPRLPDHYPRNPAWR